MSFKREINPVCFYQNAELNSALISIGIRIAGQKSLTDFNIEDVLISASIEGICQEDYRVLGLMVDWIEIHGKLINVDRLAKIVSILNDEKVRRFWKAISQWQSKDIRFKKIGKVSKIRGSADLLDVGTDFLIRKNGEDERFKGSALRVPNLTLRHRLDDIHSPQTLSQINLFYRFRLMIGASYRADLWALLEKKPHLTPTELARLTYSSFATAWGVKRDFEIFRQLESRNNKKLA